MATYDAFISYSHAKDKPIAAALQSVVQKLGKAWYQRRALRVFRDDTSLSATPHLWPSIEQALGASQYLILLASSEAAASIWVGKEVEYWLANKSADTLLIALTEGALAWDETAGDFHWSGTTPLPPALKGRFQHEPKWVDLSDYRERSNPRDSRFIELGADFAAAVRGIPKEDLLSQEVRQQRRALTLAWSAAAALLLLAGFATRQWTEAEAQRRQAQTQRDRAEATLGAGIHSANDFTVNVAARMRQTVGIPAELVRDILQRAQEFQDHLIKHNEADPKLQRSRAMLLREMSQTLLFQGDKTDALALATRAREILDALPTAARTDPEIQQERSLTYNRIGEALSQLSRRDEALASFREALAIRQDLAATRPGTEQKLALAVSHERVGDELSRLRRLDDALREYRTSFDIRAAIVKAEPDNREAQGVLAINYDRIGHTLGGVSEEAFEAFNRSLAIREQLVAGEPRNSRWQRDLANSLDYIGTYLLKIGKRDEALSRFHRSLAIREKLSAGDPRNPVWQGLLVISYVNLAQAGETPRNHYQRALDIVIELDRNDRLSLEQRPWRGELERRLQTLPPQ